MDLKAEKIALTHFSWIASLVNEPFLPRGELVRRARALAARQREIGSTDAVCTATLLKWARRYRQHGLEGLAPKPRADRGQWRVITPELAELIERLKRENPYRTGTALLRALGADSISPSTLYRFLQSRGLTTERLLAVGPERKKFEAEFANQIWQSDMLYGPYVQRPGGGKQQAYLYTALDDASRLVAHAEFYPSQGLDSLLDCVRKAIEKRGVPSRIYADNGHVYRSIQLASIAASLGILVSHTPPFQPQGRGKIERFFRTCREQCLANLDPKHRLTLGELNEQLWIWLEEYHRRPHDGLDGSTPLLRWQRDIERIRQLPPHSDVRRVFFYRLQRRVRRDSTFMLQTRFYEAPAHLAGEAIEVRFDPQDLTQVEVFHQGKFQGWARAVDPVVNAQLPPKRSAAPPASAIAGQNEVEQQHKPAPSSAPPAPAGKGRDDDDIPF
jgi:transposase InsO family protein